MTAPHSDVDECRRSHVELQVAIAGLTDDLARQPSLLPDWTVGHVLTHLARNADAMSRRIRGATVGETVDQYVGGRAGRAAEIEAGASLTARAIVADVATTSAELDSLFETMPDDVWDRMVSTVGGGEHAVSQLPFRRWREVRVHLVDLGLGDTPADWSDDLVDRLLPRLTASLAERCDQRALVAWALGRGPAPDLSPWA